jgi:hypothetical protein
MKRAFLALAAAFCAAPARAASPAVAAMETSLFLGGGFMHQQAHGQSGISAGLSAGGGVLLPSGPADNFDYYASLAYDYNPGVAAAKLPNAEDASFNRVEARLGVGLPLARGVEVIPFLAGGYQQWHRPVLAGAGVWAAETCHAGLFGGGARLDIPLTSTLVAAGSGEVLALAAGGVSGNLRGVTVSPGGFGVTPEERVTLGLDDALLGPLHIFAQAYWTHFTGSGAAAPYYEPGGAMQEGVNLGIGYSFN